MKKYMFIAAALFALAACNKNQNAPEVAPVEDDAPVAIKFGSNIAVLKTKAEVNDLGNETDGYLQGVYIYGINQDEVAVVDNVEATPAMLDDTVTPMLYTLAIADEIGNPYYYQPNDVLKFYGYYVGDAVANPAPAVNGDEITLDLTIDGSQDIMIAMADPKTDVEAATKDSKDNPVHYEWDDIINWRDRVYSAFSVRKGVTPSLAFEHLLCRFDVQIKAGSASAKDIVIKDIAVLEADTETVLTIAGNDRGFGATSVADTLHAYGPYADASMKPSDVDYTDFGKIMLFPKADAEDVYTFVFKYDFKLPKHDVNDEPIVKEFEQSFDLKAENFQGANATSVFEKGKVYTLRLTIYGPEEIKITGSVEEWIPAGTYDLDPDAL